VLSINDVTLTDVISKALMQLIVRCISTLLTWNFCQT